MSAATAKTGKRLQGQKIKLLILEKIIAKKDILFGTEAITKHDKVNCWKEICAYAHAIGALEAVRDHLYLRDVWWPNVRKLTLAKFNDEKAPCVTGNGRKLTDVDHAVLNIVGKLNAMRGLMEFENVDQEVIIADGEEDIEPVHVPVVISAPDATSKPSSLSPNSGRTSSNYFKRKRTFLKGRIDVMDWKRRTLQGKLLQLQVYHAQLQCRKLEIELGVTPSALTNNIKDSVSNLENEEFIEDNDDSSATPEMTKIFF